MKIRALGVWIEHDCKPFYDDFGLAGWTYGGTICVWLDEKLERHSKVVRDGEEIPIFDVVAPAANFELELHRQPGSYTFKRKTA